MLIVTRTTPGQSWANPVERVISLLNLAFQNITISRDFCGSEFKHQLKNAVAWKILERYAEII